MGSGLVWQRLCFQHIEQDAFTDNPSLEASSYFRLPTKYQVRAHFERESMFYFVRWQTSCIALRPLLTSIYSPQWRIYTWGAIRAIIPSTYAYWLNVCILHCTSNSLRLQSNATNDLRKLALRASATFPSMLRRKSSSNGFSSWLQPCHVTMSHA